jgi:class 3 adenylate cyclase
MAERPEERYDQATVSQVAALAARLQRRHEETLSAREIENIGSEVGLQPTFIRQALEQCRCGPKSLAVTIKPTLPKLVPSQRKRLAAAWWTAGWTLPLILTILLSSISSTMGGAAFFIGWALYIGGGAYLGAEEVAPEENPANLNRAQLLDALFILQQELEVGKRHCTFLSVDVVGSSAMKLHEPDLVVEHSFGAFQAWARRVVESFNGGVHSAAGDGMMCVFDDSAAAVRAARALQDGIEEFNRDRNRLTSPFQIRCGLSSGEVPFDKGLSIGQLNSRVVDRAALLQKQAPPGTVVVGDELASVALTELGSLSALPQEVEAGAAFIWQGRSL